MSNERGRVKVSTIALVSGLVAWYNYLAGNLVEVGGASSVI